MDKVKSLMLDLVNMIIQVDIKKLQILLLLIILLENHKN